ncbi:unnamed protein product [Linum tenue]|uniref:Cytochrome P450 n=1 Tax=Linum tenue TaxID=586396 RepID=A0AAV0II22_9ROSI|nr:unnamed protein product [Linum tenue]
MEAISHEKLSSNSFLAVLLITILMIIIIIIIVQTKKSRTSKPTTRPPPPGPWRLPVIGNLHQLAANGGRSLPHRRLAELAKRYGPDVMLLQLGELSHVIISTPEAARLVMKTHDLTFASRPSLLAVDILFSRNDVAFAPYGEHWRQMRKICTLELFSAKRVGSFRWIREQEVANLVTTLRTAAHQDEPVVDLTDLVQKLLGSVTSWATFGTIRGSNEMFLKVAKKFEDVVAGFRISDLYPSLTFLPVLTGFEGKLKKMRLEADSILDAIIDERRSQRSSRSGRDGEVGDYLLDVLLNLHENPSQLGFPLTMEAIKAVTLELFLAGIETSAKIIEWTMSEMIKHPKVMQKAQEEVREAFGEKGDIEEASLHRLKYLDSIIKESLRLHPPGPLLLPRENGESVELRGYHVPAKTKVFVNAWAINRDPRYWPEAEEFYPERFNDRMIDYRGNDFQFIPFGAGRRMCPGYDFGVEVVKLTLANLIFHFQWKLPGEMRPESLDMTERFGASVGREYALRVIPVPYHGN